MTMITQKKLPWERPDIFPEVPPNSKYGYKLGKKMVPCYKYELIEKIKKNEIPAIQLVWTPACDRLVPPAEVPFLFESLRARARSYYKTHKFISVISLIVFGLILLSHINRKGAFQPFILIFLFVSALSFLQSVRGLRTLRDTNPKLFKKDIKSHRFLVWIATQKTYGYWVIACFLLLIFAFQLFTGLASSINIAGLVKPAVKNGDVWRMLTSTLMHGNLFHLIFNLVALATLGRLIEVFTSRYYLFTIFLASAVTGSLFSIIFLPESTSIGSSGGLMGLIGFLAVFGYRYRKITPINISKSLIISIALIAVIGVFAYQLIDNAAHFGGLLIGIIFGYLIVYTFEHEESIPISTSDFMKAAGAISFLIIFLGTSFTIYKFIVWI